jgi:hypothetical protein
MSASRGNLLTVGAFALLVGACGSADTTGGQVGHVPADAALDGNVHGSIDSDLTADAAVLPMDVGRLDLGLEAGPSPSDAEPRDAGPGHEVGNLDAAPDACAPAVETCDGTDNDCDGNVDEADGGGPLTEPCYSGPPETEGRGLCHAGAQTCETDAFGACSGEVVPAAEACDGLDNNCDGQIDEGCLCTPGAEVPCYSGPAETADIGACRSGTQRCDEGGQQYGSCSGEVLPEAERCDGVDNDCNGQVDDVPGGGEDCSVGIGACRQSSHMHCDEASGELACDAVAGAPQAEVCNGIDDDCNGQVDDAPGVGAVCTAGIGACERGGFAVCNPERGEVTCAAVPAAPAAERCNGVDDDCDGHVDEDFTLGSPCTSGLGPCTRQGQLACAPDGTTACDAIPGPPSRELCNGVDDDCDGQVDNGLGLGMLCTVGVGACRAVGQFVCAPGGGVQCSAAPGAPAPEICNDIDDDCDGNIDEADDGGPLSRRCYDGPPGTQVAGVCRSGQQLCVEGVFSPCIGQVVPTDEVCDGLDNNCNGTADDGLPEVGRPCDTGRPGICARGTTMCDAGGPLCRSISAPQAETCNGIDDDCNGSVDDGLGLGDACTAGLGQCRRAGVLQCNVQGGVSCNTSPGPSSPEVCDGLDNDCDGTTDDGCPVGLSVSQRQQRNEYGYFGANIVPYAVECPQGQALIGADVGVPFNDYPLNTVVGHCGRVRLRTSQASTPYSYDIVIDAGADLPTIAGGQQDNAAIRCPANQVVTGFNVRVNDPFGEQGVYVMQFTCSTLSIARQGDTYVVQTAVGGVTDAVGHPIGTSFSDACSAGGVVVGLHGQEQMRGGNLQVAAAGLYCRQLQLDVVQ